MSYVQAIGHGEYAGLNTARLDLSLHESHEPTRIHEVYWSTNANGTDRITTAVNGQTIYLISNTDNRVPIQSGRLAFKSYNCPENAINGIRIGAYYTVMADALMSIRLLPLTAPIGAVIYAAFGDADRWANPTPLTIVG